MRQKLPALEDEKANLLYQFVTHGCGAMLVSWLRGDGNMQAREVAEFIMQISGAAVQSFSGFREEK